MTRKQHRYFTMIRDYINKNGYSPTQEEIAIALGVSDISAVSRNVGYLIKLGYMRYEGTGKVRSLVLIPEKNLQINSCVRGHNRIWFVGEACPCCAVREEGGLPA